MMINKFISVKFTKRSYSRNKQKIKSVLLQNYINQISAYIEFTKFTLPIEYYIYVVYILRLKIPNLRFRDRIE